MEVVPLRIYITAKDIREGKPQSADSCPVARAFTRAIERVLGVKPEHVTVIDALVAQIKEVHPGIDEHYNNYWWFGPPRLSEWISNYDLGDPVAPTSFVLHGENEKDHHCTGCEDH